MADYSLFIEIAYDIKKDKSKINTNVKREQVPDLLSEFLRTQMGQGADSRKAKERNVYYIKVEIDLSYDSFRVTDDTGNKSLRDGILLRVAAQERERLEGRVR